MPLLIVIAIFYFSAIDVLAQADKGWTAHFSGLGIHSSPRAADLNQDGVKDIIIGCGKKEFEKTETGVMAVDGATGKMLWRVQARDQMFGSATLLDINKDGIVDVIVGGREAELKAINGKTGKIFWEFFSVKGKAKPRDKGFFNFYNPQVVPDQNNDGIDDLIITNGGDIMVPPYDPKRAAGNILIIDSKSGSVLKKATLPDGRETYMSLVIAKLHPDDMDYTLIFGTGGETIGGNLFRTTLNKVLNEDISDATILATSKDKGFIAPPVLFDIDHDGILDIVANAVEGRIFAVSGKTNTEIWSFSLDDTEAYASMAIGHFNKDSIPDVFTTFTEGVWPNLDNSKQIMINGSTGKVEFFDSLGILQTSSPVVADFNKDGYDDALISVNFLGVEKMIFTVYYNMLVVYDFHNQSTYQLTDYYPGINLSSTPWVGDLDDDGKLDIIHCYLTDTKSETAMNGFKMVRLSLDVPVINKIKWGAYMGSNYDGIFK